MNYFIEGIQGAGKSTMARKLLEDNPDYRLYMEGDYSPVELAWNAYLTEDNYDGILEKYSELRDEIISKTVTEGNRKVVAYTQIITDSPGFHKDLEQYEIYNGNVCRREFEEIVKGRYAAWQGDGEIFECSIFQNIVENQILFYEMTDDEIIDFYRDIRRILEGKEYTIYYITVNDVRTAEEIIRKERSDDNGNEMWFPLMIGYLENSPYAKKKGLKGMDGLVKHLEHRAGLELRIINELFTDRAEIIKRTVTI